MFAGDACEAPPCQIVGFRQGRQAMDITEGARWLFQRAEEWRIPICMASIDVATAFESMSICHCAASYEARHAPVRLIAAMVRECVGLYVQPTLANVMSRAPIPVCCGSRQGGKGTSTPISWNSMLAPGIEDLITN